MTPPPMRALEPPPSVREPRGPAGGRGSGGSGEQAAVPPTATARIAVWLVVGAITVLFAAFTSTFLVRRAEADWRAAPLPPILWLTTAIILGSSAALEQGRRHGRRGGITRLHAWLVPATRLGVAFLAGQLLASAQVGTAGIYLA